MKKAEFKRRLYVRPETRIVEMEDELSICQTSVVPQVPGSTEEEWEDEEIEIGEETI